MELKKLAELNRWFDRNKDFVADGINIILIPMLVDYMCDKKGLDVKETWEMLSQASDSVWTELGSSGL